MHLWHLFKSKKQQGGAVCSFYPTCPRRCGTGMAAAAPDSQCSSPLLFSHHTILKLNKWMFQPFEKKKWHLTTLALEINATQHR